MDNISQYFNNELSHYGDVLAVPFFGMCTYYFYNIKRKNMLEYILLIFSVLGFVLDILYTYIYFTTKDTNVKL